MKRLLDIFISFFGLIFLSPVIIATALAVKLEDRGPVLYRASRVGIFGVSFTMYKFRTMVVDAENVGPASASSDDRRITKTGKFLRKFKIDEIPQLLNVLLGNMSIVGPRPEIRRFTDTFTEEEKTILKVKPGITDWASIWNSNEGQILEGAEDTDSVYIELIRPEKIRLQLQYVKNHNFFIDLKIIFLTMRKIVFGK
jgi:lipopolysaccharide/colanic/teichoic acid biosynthesis glycosyltransferase